MEGAVKRIQATAKYSIRNRKPRRLVQRWGTTGAVSGAPTGASAAPSVGASGSIVYSRSTANRVRTFFVKYRFFHFLVLPGIVYFLVFHYLPLVGSIIAFKDYNGMGGVAGLFNAPWVGFKYFDQLFQSYYFWRLLRNTLIISSLKLIFAFPAPIFLALLLNEIRMLRFRKVVQTVSYLPHFLSWVVIAGLVQLIVAPYGPLNALLQDIGLRKVNLLADARYFRGVLVVSSIWQGIGWGSIVYLAAISTVPEEQYEAAILEGATRFQRTWFVTLPSIRFVVVIFLILAVGRIIDEDFEQIFNLYNPAVYQVADVFETFVYRRGILQADFSYATAVGLFKSVTSLILVVVTNKVATLLGQEGLW